MSFTPHGKRLAKQPGKAELKALDVEHRKRVAAVQRQHAAGVRRQKELFRSIGVPDLSPEEIMARAKRSN